MNVLDLPDDIIDYIYNIMKKEKIKDLNDIFDKLLNQYMILHLRFYDIVRTIIYSNYVDLKNINLFIERDYNKFKIISVLDKEYLENFRNDKIMKKMYNINCRISNIQELEKIEYNEFIKYIDTLIISVFDEKVLHKLFTFLHVYKNDISIYLNSLISLYPEREYMFRIKNISDYAIKTWICNVDGFFNEFSEFTYNLHKKNMMKII